MTTERHEPFPLTDTQRAYLIGRGDFYPLGNVSTHAYLEYDCVIDPDRFAAAWDRVLARHDMLRAVVDPQTATQRVLTEVPDSGLALHDLRGLDEPDAEAAVAATRETMAHEVRPSDRYPIFGMALSLLSDTDDRTTVRARLHVGIDGLTLDYASWHVLLRDLSIFYDDLDADLSPPACAFRDYVLAAADLADPQDRAEAHEYWEKILPDLPGPPHLPLRREPESVTHPRFDRLDECLDASTWSRLQARATEHGLTASGLMVAAFAQVVAHWSATPRFTLNIPRMGRSPLLDGVEDVAGEFATFTLIDIDAGDREPFTDFARRAQRRMWDALEHGAISGVELLRRLGELHGSEHGPVLMPVVLTSTLAFAKNDSALVRALRPVYHITSTPQVYLDVQLEERLGELYVNWDYVRDMLRPGVIEAMFAAWSTLLHNLASDERTWRSTDPIGFDHTHQPPTSPSGPMPRDTDNRDSAANSAHQNVDRARVVRQPNDKPESAHSDLAKQDQAYPHAEAPFAADSHNSTASSLDPNVAPPQGDHTRGDENTLAHSDFLTQVRERPDATALIGADGSGVTYAQLHARASTVAWWLHEAASPPVKPDEPEPIVAIVMTKSCAQIAAAIGVLCAGCAYLPIDPELPAASIAALLDRARPAAILTDTTTAQALPNPTTSLPTLVVDQLSASPATPLLFSSRAVTHPATPPPMLDADELSVSPEPALPPATAPSRALPHPATPLPTPPVDQFSESSARALPPTTTTARSLAYLLPTSGSTGEPKLVAVEHGGVVNCLRATARAFGLGPDDRSLAVTALHHDMSLFDVFGMLGAGGCVVVPDAARRVDPEHWLALMSEHGVTVWNSVPAMMRMLLDYRRESQDDGSEESTLRLSFLGGDWFPLDLAQNYRAAYGSAELVSVGGPTETTLWNIWHRVGDPDRDYPDWISVPYGTPIPGARYHLLDERGFECPAWVVGEMCCSGIGVAREYRGDPELTAQRFIRHPATGLRLYRTGDLGRRRPDGTIEFIGRRDSQVQLRGRRVEPSAVEAALRTHPAVRHAVVTAVAQVRGPGHRALIGHVEADTDEQTLLGHLRDRIAEYLVPSRILVVDTLPLTASGKVDRAALTAHGTTALNEPTTVPGTAADTALTTVIAAAWADVLGLDRVGPRDNFFTLGGDSLAATRILARLRRELAGCEISARAVLAGIDVETCAQALLAYAGPQLESAARRALGEQPEPMADSANTVATQNGPLPQSRTRDGQAGPGAHTANASAAQTDLLSKRTAHRPLDGRPEPTAITDEISAPQTGPLSAAQRRMWFAERLAPDSAANHLAVMIRLDDGLDPDTLCAALADVVARHTVLRTVYRADADGLPRQHILDRPFEVAPVAAPDPIAHAHAAAVRPFRLGKELPIRAGLARADTGDARNGDPHDDTARSRATGDWLLWIVLHHIAFDDYSWDILFSDLSTAYRTRRHGDVTAPIAAGRYLDHALAEDERAQRAEYAAAREHWRRRSLRARPGTMLPPRKGRRVVRDLSSTHHAEVTTVARAQGISTTTVLMTAAAMTVGRRIGSDTVVLAVPVVDRSEPGAESVLGNFGNLVLIDIDLTAADPLAEVAAKSLDAYAHQQVPFDVVVADQRAARPGDSGPLFDAVFSARGALAGELNLDGVSATVTPIDLGTARFDLVLECADTGTGHQLGIVADSDRYRADEAQTLLGEFHTTLIELCSSPTPVPQAPPTGHPLLSPTPPAPQAPSTGQPRPTARKEVQMTGPTEFDDAIETPDMDAIAVIGMDGRFPGAPDLTVFWDNLIQGRESAREFTLEQFLAAGGTEAEYDDPALVRVASSVEGIDRFDADFFGYRPSEAELIDPQQRLFLECCHHALEHSGQAPGRFDGRIGVYAGASQSRYFLENVYPHVMDQTNSMASLPATSGSSPGGIATRVAYKLGLTGPALSVQTACSTSLVAIHVACQDLLNYQCDVALAGGASLNPTPHQGYQAIADGPLSPDGRCRAFDAGANGMFPGDGVGVVVLKRLADALADGDPIRAVIKGSAVNNDGNRKAGYGAPSAPGQVEVILAAQAAAGITPDQVGYVEAHGTGTPVGDPIELSALGEAFRTGTDRTGYCLLGSVKTNLGHLDAAAGIAGFIKTVLALENRTIPPSLHFSAPNPLFDLDASPFRVAADRTEWSESIPDLAAVSSFGIGGTNAHVILGPAPRQAPRPDDDGPAVLTVSARTPAALERAAGQLAAHLRTHPRLRLADVAHTLRAGREDYEYRTAVVASEIEEARTELVTVSPARARATRPVVFVLPGGGTEYARMGLGLYTDEPAFREVITAAAAIAEPLTGVDLVAQLHDPQGFGDSGDSAAAFVAVVATEIALAAALADHGVTPAALIGHSLGEYSAACIAGVMSLDDTIRVVVERARLLDRSGGAATSVLLGPDDLADYLGPNLGLATINGPLHTTVSGPVDEIAALEAVLEAKGVDVSRLPLPAVHSALLDPELPALARVLATVSLNAPRIPMISNVSGAWLSDAEATDPDYWIRHTRHTVRFADGIDTLVRDLSPLFVETGPGRGLTRLIELQAGREAVAPPTMRHRRDDGDDRVYLLRALGGIWAAGAAVDLTAAGEPAARKVTLPGYPFERRRFWIDPPARATARPFDLFGYLDRCEGELRKQIPVEHTERGLDARLESLCALYVARFLREIGCATDPGALVDPAAVVAELGFVAPYERFFDALLSLLVADGYAVRDGARLRLTETPCGDEQLDRERAALLARYPDAEEELAFLDYCSARYRQVCTGELAGTEVMIVDGSDDRSTEVVDKRLAHSDVAIYTRLVGSVLRELAAGRDRPLRVLEIGAGQGYLTWPVAEAVHGTPVEYTFTDLGRSFVVAAQRRAQEQGYDWMRFGVLDVTGDAEAQGFTEPFDVVLAFNVLHATPELATTVSQVHSLLAPGGRLLLLESAQQRRVSMLTAGLFEGWWYFTDDLRTHSPLVAPGQWAELMRGAGFTDVRVQSDADAVEGAAPVDHALIVGSRARWDTTDTQAPADRGMFGGGSAFNARPNLAVAYRAPEGPLQHRIANAWQAVLGIDKVGADDDFFDLGGESLLAMQLVTSLRKELGVSLSVKQFFSSGDLTVKGLAGLVERARAGNDTDPSADVIVPSARRKSAVRS
ncbi:type I polyketide synthase [Nocardia alni]|uniref:type I polyketide synthase n=1 Tax=Nocardia alni TaxID=2815723 RepID=UPI001C2478D7|nr:type I polyketide synthase [Nocardia alni]